MKTLNKTEKLENLEKQMIEYLRRSSYHLFLHGKNFYKVVPFTYKGEWYYMTLSFGNDSSTIRFGKVKAYTGNSLKNLKNEVFPNYPGVIERKTIKNFKRMNSKMEEIMDLISEDFKGSVSYFDNKELKSKMSKSLEEMKLEL